ncbi:MAG: hypothetical protein HC886_05390 [Leptolyngbyaceae cyanobacterium SM1_1_3]|nr:hypothetical protein [Leptolyngbyaceae cyanobacterium SM1_1_3]NJO09330.1 hypothetical protein [Leptolyngbyaceae cyanobacterium SL_1_1]
MGFVGCRPRQTFEIKAIAPALRQATGIGMLAVSSMNLPKTPVLQTAAYTQAQDYGASALAIAETAYSPDDWQLVVNYWQQAVDLLESLPATAASADLLQRRLSLYRQNLQYAQQQRDRPNPAQVVAQPALAAQQPAPLPRPVLPNRAAESPSSKAPEPSAHPASQQSVPIVRRLGRTPVVSVSFNQAKRYDMIVDTGASGTLITQKMAADLNITPIGQARVTTASAVDILFPVGYVPSIQVGNIVANNVLVAIAGPEQTVGLLGHDVFGDYDVTVRQEVVEFQAR